MGGEWSNAIKPDLPWGELTRFVIAQIFIDHNIQTRQHYQMLKSFTRSKKYKAL
jgi:hypothetical protein